MAYNIKAIRTREQRLQSLSIANKKREKQLKAEREAQKKPIIVAADRLASYQKQIYNDRTYFANLEKLYEGMLKTANEKLIDPHAIVNHQTLKVQIKKITEFTLFIKKLNEEARNIHLMINEFKEINANKVDLLEKLSKAYTEYYYNLQLIEKEWKGVLPNKV